MIQVQIRIFKFKFEFSSNPLSKHDWRTHIRLTYVPRASFSERRNTWSPHMKHIHLFILYFSHHRNKAYICTSVVDILLSIYLYRRTSIDVCKSWRHLHLYWSTRIFAPFAPLLIHLNCIQESTRCKESTSTRDSFQKKELVDFGTKPTGIDSFQKKESVDLGTRCTEERKILAFRITFHFSFFSTKSS